MNRQKHGALIALCLLVVCIHQLTALTETQFYLTQLTMAAYYGLVIIGLGVLMGYAGQISIGHAGFFAIGGYLAAALTTRNLLPYQGSWPYTFLGSCGILNTSHDLYGDPLVTVVPWAAGFFAVAMAALIAVCIGIPVLKLKGHYLAMATLGFGTIIYRLVLATPYFGEADGISGVPGFTVLPALGHIKAIVISGGASLRVANFYFSCAVLICCTWLLLNLIGSRVGRALRSLHSSEDAAEACGVDTARSKLQVFVLSAVYAAIAGVLLTHFNGGIGPSEASVMKSVRYVALVAVGGMTNLWGTLIMGATLTFLSLRGVFGSFDDVVFGLILITVMLFAPDGIFTLHLRHGLQRIILGRRS